MSRPRVLLAEDHPLLREAIERLLAEKCDVIGTVERGDEVLEAASQTRPDALILDISLPGLSGLQALPYLRSQLPEIIVIMLTAHSDPFYREEAFRLGADGYVMKGRAPTELLGAVHRALASRSLGERALWRENRA